MGELVVFFVILVLLMVLAVAAGSWMQPRPPATYDREVVDAGPEVVEEIVDEPLVRPIARSRRVVRRRRFY